MPDYQRAKTIVTDHGFKGSGFKDLQNRTAEYRTRNNEYRREENNFIIRHSLFDIRYSFLISSNAWSLSPKQLREKPNNKAKKEV